MRVRERGAARRAAIGDDDGRGGAVAEGHVEAALEHGEYVRQRRRLQVFELQLVAGRVDDHFVTLGEGRELVGHHAHSPARLVGRAAHLAQSIHLGRRQVF